jgi:hypothetical protein
MKSEEVFSSVGLPSFDLINSFPSISVPTQSYIPRGVAEGTFRERPVIFFLLMERDFWYCGKYWPIVPAPNDM